MSNTVDERIVEMRFDNKQFESNVQTTLGTLDKLKKGLDLDGAAKGLDGISTAAKNVDMNGLGSAVETVKEKFSALEVMAVTALVNITNSAVNAGKQLVKSLTIDQVKAGFEEYELKMNSVQTIMNGTGASLEDVMGKLNELNTYADKTIYSFSDMTSNIGKFTNAGVGLNESVAAIQGVANVAAVSGANAENASHAMYNFAQAISAGSVKLIDWKSIENANMATVEFKDQLLQTALELGTVVKEGDKYVSTTTDMNGKVSEAFNETSKFNESLSSQWMTTEVLTQTLAKYADETTDIGKKAFAAATEVKTFHQLLDTVKESIGSGWAETFELIIGNFNEAKELWTNVNNEIDRIVGNIATKRNETIKEWRKFGGRTSLIKTFSHVWEGLLSVIKPVKEAFQEIFPAKTGRELANLTSKISVLTTRLKINSVNAQRLKDTFKGFFSVFSIAGKVISSVVKAISPLVKITGFLGSKILKFTAFLGGYITKANEALDGTNAFFTILDKIHGALESAYNSIIHAQSGISSFADAVKQKLEPLKRVFDNVRDSISKFFDSFKKEKTQDANDSVGKFSKIASALKGLGSIFQKIGSKVAEGIVKISKGFNEAFTNFEFDKFYAAIDGALLSSILLGISGVFNKIKKFIGSGKDLLDSISDIFSGVGDAISAFTTQVKAKTLLKIASAIAILSASLVVMSMIDSKKLAASLGIMSATFADLFGSMAIFEKISGGGNFRGLSRAATGMIKMSVAVLILASAMKKLGDLEWNQLKQGLLAVVTLTATLVIASKVLNTGAGKVAKVSIGVIIFAEAIRILGKAVAEIGNLKIDAIKNGLIGVGVLLGELAVFMKATDTDKLGMIKGVGILLLANSIKVLSSSVEIFAKLKPDEIMRGLVTVGGILAEIAAFLRVTGDAKHVISTGIALLIIAKSMQTFQTAISAMGALSKDTIVKGLITMGVALAEIAIAVKLMPGTLPLIGVGIVLIANAMASLSGTIKAMGETTWTAMAKGLITLAGSLAIITIAVKTMSGALAGAAAIVIVTSALKAFSPIIQQFGQMKLSEIGKSLLVLAGTFAVIGVAGALLTPVIPALLGLGTAITLLGVGVAATGIGILSLATAMTVLSTTSVVNAASFVSSLSIIVLGIANLIPEVARKIGEGFITFVQTIADSTISLVNAVVSIGNAIFDALEQLIPRIINFAGSVVIAFLTGIRNHIGEATELVSDIIVNFENALAEKIPSIVDAGVNLTVSFINGMAQGIRDASDKIIPAVRNLVAAVGELFISGLQLIVEQIPLVGGQLSNKLEEAKQSIREQFPPSEMEQIGYEEVSAISTGMDNAAPEVESSAESVGDSATSGLLSKFTEFTSLGDTFGLGYADALTGTNGEVSLAALGLGDTAIEGISTDAMTGIGSDQGTDYANGLLGTNGLLSSVASGLQDTALSGISTNAMTGIGSGQGKDYASGLNSQKSNASTTAGNVANSAKVAIDGYSQRFNVSGSTNGRNYVQGVSSNAPNARSAGSSLGSSGYQGASSYQSSYYTAGSNSGSGFTLGIRSKIGDAANAAAQMAKSALDAAKAKLGIHSPSKVFEEEVGIQSDEGAAKGFLKGSGIVEDSAANVGESAVDSMRNALSQIPDILNGDIESKPVIRPILDLSDIQSRAGRIGEYFGNLSVPITELKSLNESNFEILQNEVSVLADAITRIEEKLSNSQLSDIYSIMQEYFPEFTNDIYLNEEKISDRIERRITTKTQRRGNAW